MSFIPLLQAAQGAPQQQNLLMSVVPFILIIAIFYFFIIRPQNKKQKETEKMINALKKGDKVVTIGGIHGVVSSTKEKTIIVKVDSNTSIEFNRSAIAAVVRDEVKAAKPAKKETKSEAKAEEAAPEAKTEAAESTESASENK
ncbi:MAG: preprotein translocase subunit YajC [Treponema sp.]|nr:preprotein translocase subunit YajC [Treponema sp.]